jgi:hypothetical protein
MVASGMYHVFALKTDGSVYSWGKNDLGQLGRSPSVSDLIPTAVSGLGASSGVVAIAAGYSHTVALKTDGSVLSWGNNANGQLGIGISVSTPTATGLTSGVVAIACGHYHTVVLKNDGSVWASGRNTEGQIGDGTKTNRSSFVFITTGTK